MYLVRTRDNWYQLRLASSHFTLGCGPKVEVLLKTAHDYVVKYCHRGCLEEAVGGLSYKWNYCERELVKRNFEYEHRDSELNRKLLSVVEEALKEVKENTPLRRVQNRIKTLVVSECKKEREQVVSSNFTRKTEKVMDFKRTGVKRVIKPNRKFICS